jgi:hypothetical protein
MTSHEGTSTSKPSLFDGKNFAFWKIRMRTYLMALGADVWDVVETGYTKPVVLTSKDDKLEFSFNAKGMNAILNGLAEAEFVKVIHLDTAKAMWDKLINSYEGNEKVKDAKLQTYRLKFEQLKMNEVLIFQNPNPVSVSLIFQSNLNAKLSFSTVSAYATAWCFNIFSQWCFSISICYSLVFQHLFTTVFQHQHMLQPGVSASAHSGVSASSYATAWCFSIYSALCFSIYSAWCSSIYSAWCFILCYSLVFQHKLQPGVLASKTLNRK